MSRHQVRVKGLEELKFVKKTLAEQALARERLAQSRAKAAREAAAEHDLFVRTVGAVKPVAEIGRAHV